ncbi:hypothetical protein V8B97DRAFT_1918108 [Scleroderma yunnanense]
MSVATKNPFSVLDEDQSRPSSPPPPAQPQATPTPANRGNQRGRGGPASRGGRYYSRGGATTKGDANRDPATTEEPAAGAEGTRRRPDGERREGRGRGRGGGRGAGRGRTFDRHSATGKTDSEKKVHQSWGGDDGDTELKVEEAAGMDAAQESNINDWAGTGASGDTAAGADDPWSAPAAEETTPAQVNGEVDKPEARRRDKEEEEDNTLTLDQYLAQQKERESAVVAKLETRKANEGDDSIWNGATRLEKGDGEAYFAGKTKNTHKARTEKKEKVFLEIDAHFDRPRGDRGGRGRGGFKDGARGRGGRGRGAPGGYGRDRGGENGGTRAVDVDDENAFPALS